MTRFGILNQLGTPRNVHYGIDDKSQKQVPRTPLEYPQHLPLFYLFTKKGKVGVREMGTAADLQDIFGIESFTPDEPWYNHASFFAATAMQSANTIMVERVIPEDAGPEANFTLWIDLQESDIQQYQRTSDGKFLLDVNNLKIPVTGAGATKPGYKLKFLTTSELTKNDLTLNWGTLSQKVGTVGASSVQIPLISFKNTSIGSVGNADGVRIWSQTTDTVGNISTALLTEKKTFPYYISVIQKTNSGSSSQLVKTLFGSEGVGFTLSPGVKNPETNSKTYLDDVFLDSYQFLNDPSIPNLYGAFSDIHIYQNNIDSVLLMLLNAEIAGGVSTWADFTSDVANDLVNQKYLYNLFGGTTSDGVPYSTYQLVTAIESGGENSILLNKTTDIYCKGGSDGTMTNEIFEDLVMDKIVEYGHSNSTLLDSAENPETFFWDSGFSLQGKYKLVNFISRRKDTFVVYTTQIPGISELSPEDEISIGIAIRDHLSLYPESERFGTPMTRAAIVAQSARVIGGADRKRVPASREWLVKTCRAFGAGNGKWKREYIPSSTPNSVVQGLYDFNYISIGADSRNAFWRAGLNLAVPYQQKTNFYPAFITVYPYDNSILKSYVNAVGACTLARVSDQSWREFSGNIDLDDGQLIDSVQTFITLAVKGKFGDVFTIIPEVEITAIDKALGYSWTTNIKMGGRVPKHVQNAVTTAYRAEDLATNTN